MELIGTDASTDCRLQGVDHYKCSVCGGTRDSQNGRYGAHILASCTDNGNGTHTGSCGVCGKTATAACSYSVTQSTKGSDCQHEGTDTYTCADCGAEKTSANGQYGDHKYVFNKCKLCGEKRATLISRAADKVSDFFRNMFSDIRDILTLPFRLPLFRNVFTC